MYFFDNSTVQNLTTIIYYALVIYCLKVTNTSSIPNIKIICQHKNCIVVSRID